MPEEIINVLIVEDNDVLRETLSWLLKSSKIFDYNVMDVASGEEAVKRSIDHDFEIIIMDYRMPPGMSGLEATKQILKLKPEIKILSYTTDLYSAEETADLKWYQMNILPYIQGEVGKINGVIITFVDITARIRELNTLEKLISDHETLLDTISHDVKTPLTTLVLTIELFKNVSPEDQKEFQKLLQRLDTAIKKIHDIINELTDARKQEHKYKSEEELLNFGHILEDVRLTLSHNIKESAQS